MIRALILVTLLLILWLVAGRQLSLLADRVLPMRATSLPVSPLHYDGGSLVIGDTAMVFASIDNQRADVRLTFDASNRVVLQTGHGSITLGPRTSTPDPAGRPEIDFAAEPGDDVSFTSRSSALSWTTAFQIKIMGTTPRWRRYVYYQLHWHKRSGAKLAMLWRYEQQYYAVSGWTKPAMMWNSQTGLLSVDIQPLGEMNSVVTEYIARTKGWNPGDYRIDSRGITADGRSEIFAVLHKDDGRGASPGGGKSVELYLDRGSRQVTKELAGQ